MNLIDKKLCFILFQVGSRSLPTNEAAELSKLMSNMSNIYASTKVCLDKKQCMTLEPGLTNIMAESSNYSLRSLVWQVVYLFYSSFIISVIEVVPLIYLKIHVT